MQYDFVSPVSHHGVGNIGNSQKADNVDVIGSVE
jgi:hypothetical protein